MSVKQRLTIWDSRAARAGLLAERYVASKEILLFYANLAEWQGKVASKVQTLEQVNEFLPSLCDLVGRAGPAALIQAAQDFVSNGARNLVEEYWDLNSPAPPLDFFARALLQPYAGTLPAATPCPWCTQAPQVGSLRPQGEGLALDLVCSLCLRSRSFARARCPGCNESAEDRLLSFSAPDFVHLRLQVCETCQAYLPLVDLSRDPQAIPEVDELAGLPLDLWAQDQGYHKLQPNLAGV
jgi:FdhE protein